MGIILSIILIGICLYLLSWFDSGLVQVLGWMSFGYVYVYVLLPIIWQIRGRRQLPTVLKGLSDPYEHNRVEAIQQLGNLLGLGRDEDTTILDGFCSIISSASKRDERKEVIQALDGYLSSISSFHARMMILYHRSPEYPLQIVLKALGDKSLDIRARAVFALRHTDAICTINPLLKALNDPHDSVRKMAGEILADGCPDVETIVFGRHAEEQRADQKHTLVNPDVSNLTVPLSHLKKIVFDGDTCQMSLVNRFVTYMEAYGESDARPLKEEVSIRFIGNPLGFHSEVYRFCQKCRRIEVGIETVIFGERSQDSLYPDTHTVFNPDVSHFTLPMSRMKQVIIAADSYDFYRIEQFLTYAINYLGQTYLKRRVDIHIYGNPTQIHSNLYNSLQYACRRIIQHETMKD